MKATGPIHFDVFGPLLPEQFGWPEDTLLSTAPLERTWVRRAFAWSSQPGRKPKRTPGPRPASRFQRLLSSGEPSFLSHLMSGLSKLPIHELNIGNGLSALLTFRLWGISGWFGTSPAPAHSCFLNSLHGRVTSGKISNHQLCGCSPMANYCSLAQSRPFNLLIPFGLLFSSPFCV